MWLYISNMEVKLGYFFKQRNTLIYKNVGKLLINSSGKVESSQQSNEPLLKQVNKIEYRIDGY